MKYSSLEELLSNLPHLGLKVQATSIDSKDILRFEFKDDETGTVLFEDSHEQVLIAFLDHLGISFTRF